MTSEQCKYLKPSFGFMLCGEYENQTHCCDIKNCYYKQLQAEKEKAIKYLQMYYKAKAGLL